MPGGGGSTTVDPPFAGVRVGHQCNDLHKSFFMDSHHVGLEWSKYRLHRGFRSRVFPSDERQIGPETRTLRQHEACPPDPACRVLKSGTGTESAAVDIAMRSGVS